MEPGYFKGETCNRDGCTGIITEHDILNGKCTCHINPPCYNCLNTWTYCRECEWDGIVDAYHEKQKTGIPVTLPTPPITNGLVGFYAGKMDVDKWNDLSGNNNHLKMQQ